MKKIILILSISLSLQSCFSYKSADYNSIAADTNQKVEVEMLDRTIVKGQLISKDEKSIIVENNGNKQTILKDEIFEVKVVKFSVLKTAGNILNTAAWAAAGLGILFLIAAI
tara:strand:- start:537 stop:872 length:336 start_codon:yes stop_codon:yes gene_type:complete